MSLSPGDFDNAVEIQWCPGCGNFAILAAMKRALASLELRPDQLLLCSGIGQAPKLPHYLRCNLFNGLHGREVPAATGAKLAADDLTVVVHAGDGGAFGEGGNHFLAAIRRNSDLTLVVHDNRVYGLTKGQASPTTEAGTRAALQPEGVPLAALNPLALAISQGCSFVAQATSARPDHLVQVLVEAVRHKGFSLVNVLQPCVTWDKVHTHRYYADHTEPLPADHDPADQLAALRRVLEPGGPIPLGVIFRRPRPTYEDVVLAHRARPLRDHPVDPGIVEPLFDDFR